MERVDNNKFINPVKQPGRPTHLWFNSESKQLDFFTEKVDTHFVSSGDGN